MAYNFLRDARSIENSFLCVHDSLDSYSSDFHVNGDVDSWDIYDNIYLYGSWNSMVFGTAYDRDCYISRTNVFPIVEAEDYYYIKLMMKITNNNSDKAVQGLTTGRIQWVVLGDSTWNSDKQIDFDITADGKWRLYNINMGPAQWWQGNINNLRIHPFIDGWSGDHFAIKYIKISSLTEFACDNRQCSYYSQYAHPCLGAGVRGSCEAGTSKSFYTTVSGVNDELAVNIDGYGDEYFRLGTNKNVSGIEMAKVIGNQISTFNIGGYAYSHCEYSEADKLKITSGTVGSTSAVEISGLAAEALGFDTSSKVTGTEPATGFDYAAARFLTAQEINRLIDGVTEEFAYMHDPIQYSVEGGRRDFNEIGTSRLTSSITSDDYYESLNNVSKTLIDYSHPINNNGRLKAVYIYGKIDSLSKIKILRPRNDGQLTVIYSLDLPLEDVGKMYTTNPVVYRLDCDVLVNKGDLIGIYNADLYVGVSISGLPDATFCQITGEVSGTFDPGLPYSFGLGGFAMYARGDRWQTNTILDIDLGNRVNIEEVNVYGSEDASYFEFNIASCLDVSWSVDLFGGTHIHEGIFWWTGFGFTDTHTNIAIGTSALYDMIKTADNGNAGDSLESTSGQHSYFYVTGDAEWLYNGECVGSTEYCGLKVPFGTKHYINDPIAFTLKFPNEYTAPIHKSIIYFKERDNFRSMALSYYLGKNISIGNADDNNYQRIPSYTSIKLDGLSYEPDDGSIASDYIFNNPTNATMQYATAGYKDPINWKEFTSAAITDWTIIEHNFDTIECKGLRIYTNHHNSTKITEMEVYSKAATTPSLLDNVTLTSSDYGEVWVSSSFEEITSEKVTAFLGGAPRYITIELEAATAFAINEIEFLVGDQVKTGDCSDIVLLDTAKSKSTNEATELTFENIYDKPFDLSIDVPRETYDMDNILFWSKLGSYTEIDKPEIGPGCKLFKSEDYDIRNDNRQCAINTPGYGLKNLVDGKEAYYSYNEEDYVSWGTMVSGTSPNFCNTPYENAKTTTLSFTAVSSQYWKIYISSASLPVDIYDIIAYYDNTRVPITTVYPNNLPLITSQTSGTISDGTNMASVFGTSSNQSLVGTASASSIFDAPWPASRINDGSTAQADRWVSSSAPLPHWAQIEWTSKRHITQVNFWCSTAGGESFSEYWIEYWDGSSWQTADYDGSYSCTGSETSIAVTFTTIKARIRMTPAGTYVGLYELEFIGLEAGNIYISSLITFGFDINTSDPVDEIKLIHRDDTEIHTASIYTSPDNASNYIEAVGSANVTIDPVNVATQARFAVDLEKRHDLEIVRNYGTSNLYFISTGVYTDFSNDNVSNVDNVTWGNSTKDDSRWVRITIPNDSTTNCIRKLGIYPDISTVFCTGGGYNCEWWPLGNILSDYEAPINVAYGATTTGSNYYFHDYYTDNAVNGITTDYDAQSCWGFQQVVGSSVDPYIEIDFGQTYLINKIELYHGLNPEQSTPMNTDYTFSVTTAASGGTFTTVHSGSSNDDHYVIHQFNPVYARRARLTVTGYDGSRILILDPDTGLYDYFKGSFLREIEVYTYTDAGYVSSEDWPIVAMDLTDQFNVTDHDLINKDVTDSAADWNNAEEFFMYSDNRFDDPKKVSFTREGEYTTYYQKTETLTAGISDGDPIISTYTFGSNVYFDEGVYIAEFDVWASTNLYTSDYPEEAKISLRLEGPTVADSYANVTTASTWLGQSNRIEVTEAGFYSVKAIQHVDPEYGWGFRNPYIYRSTGLIKWVSVKRDTATNYSYDDDSGKYGKDYLSTLKVYGDEKYNPTEYSWWWSSNVSTLSNDALIVKTGTRSLKIEYPASSDTDTVEFIEGDDLGQDSYFDIKDLLHFWWYIDDVSKLDISFGDITFGIINTSDNAYYKWDISSLSLSTGWNNIKLKFEDADTFYPETDGSLSISNFLDEGLDFRNNDKDFASIRLRFKGLGQAFIMNIDDLKIQRNVFDDSVKFGKGICLTGHDYLEIPLSGITLEKGTVEFWMKAYTDSYGRNIFDDMNSRLFFSMVNNNNDIVSLAIQSGAWLQPAVGHIRKALATFNISNNDLPTDSFISVGDVVHIALVWSNNGEFTDNKDTIRLYINGELIVNSKVTWELEDTKSALIKLGGASAQMANNQDSYGSAVFDNVKMYNYCRTEFDLVTEGVEKEISYTPNEFLQISENNIDFYGMESTSLPIVFQQVPAGASRTIYVRADKNENFAQSKNTANIIVSWLTTV